MKNFLNLFILGISVAFAVRCAGQMIEEPGWFHLTGNALETLSIDDVPTNQPQVKTKALISSPLNMPSSPVAEAITPEIQALADGLRGNPALIFDYVHDHIKFVLYFGSKKGAQLTLLEKSGNDFDQCALLVALLRAAGYTDAQYKFGMQKIPYDDPSGMDYDLRHWWRLTLNNTNWTNTVNYVFNLLGNRGYPTAYYDGDGNSFYFQRMWVSFTYGTNTFLADPAFKRNRLVSSVAGFSLTNAMGGAGMTISNSLITVSGGTNNGNFVQNLDEAALRNRLTSYTTNLLNSIYTNAPNASVEEVLGGWQIVPADDVLDLTTTTRFPYGPLFGYFPVLTWTYQPTNLMSTFKIAIGGTNYQWFMPQLLGQRVSLTFDATGNAQLWQDDVNLFSKNISASRSRTNVVFTMTHPYGGWDITNNIFLYDPTNSANMIVTNSYQSTNATYAIVYSFEPADSGWLKQRQKKLGAYLQQGLTNGTRQVTSETLNIMGLTWLLQGAQLSRLIAPQLGILEESPHRIGRAGQELGQGYYVDVYAQIDSSLPGGGDDAGQIRAMNAHFNIWTMFTSAFEHGVIEQFQSTNIVGASTVKMLQIANTNGQVIYLASSTNWATAFNVKSRLNNYNSADIADIEKYISKGCYVLLPKNGSNHVSNISGSWAGYGFWGHLKVNGVSAIAAAVISGDYHGGFSSLYYSLVDVFTTDYTAVNSPFFFNTTPIYTPAPLTADPVDTANGTFQIESTDLSTGQAEPRGLTLSRYYNGSRRFNNPAGMAAGWIHNYSITANSVAATDAGLGGTTPAQAASMLVATASAVALHNNGYPDSKNWLVTALITKWGVDQTIKNGVTVNLGKECLQFVQQPNGTFTPPAGSTATLTRSNSAYVLQMRHDNKFRFNPGGFLTNLTDPYGQALNVTYNASNWVSTVTDWKGRALTFNYTGTPLRLTSVSDGTRTVAYGFSTANNPQGDLTSFTDAEGKTTSYLYDTNHLVTATLDAQNRLVVTNIYDTQGHVSKQFAQGDTNKLWRINWTDWIVTEFDPANGQTDFFYDVRGRLTSVLDPLEQLRKIAYDGQNHIVQTISPLDETNRFVYDGNHNVIQTIDPLGFTNQFFFDGQDNMIRSVDPRGIPSTFGYNGQFSLVGATNGAGDFVNSAFNADGTLQSQTDAGGTTLFDGYDSYGQLTHITYPNSLGTESFVNSLIGDVTSHTDGNGNVTTFAFNNRRQMTNFIAPTNRVTSAAFDPVGNQASATDARGNTTSNLWSATRNLIATFMPPMPQGIPVVSNVYDNRDWLVKKIDPLQRTTQFTNDAAGRLIAQTDPLQRTTRFGLDANGRRLTTTNAAQIVTRQTWDKRGKMLSLTDGANHVSTRVYDPAGNQITLTNRNGKKWQFQFDGANRATNTITPRGFSASVAFNQQGKISTSKDAANQTTTMLYDAKKRMTARTDNVGSTAYVFDANDNPTKIVENGLTNAFTYDAYNQVSSYTDVYGNLIQYRQDANGNVTNLIYPGGKNVYYAFDSNNHLTNVTDWSNRKTAITCDLAGQITSITRPNGTYRTVGFDAAGQATNILEQMGNTLPIAWFKFNWTNTGNMAWEFTAPLPHAATVPTRTMTYDDDNRLATVNGQSVGSDANGNMTNAPLTNSTLFAHAYDARNRLRSAGGVTNVYDAMDNRIAQMQGTNTTLFVVNPNAKLPQVLMRIKNGVTNYYIYGVGLLYQITETATATNTLTYHFDFRGSTVALTDDNGKVTDRVEYSAYGLTTYRTGTNDTPFLFNGRYGVMTDLNSLLYMRARYYNPYLCRFISADPSGFAGGLNWYAFASGNPVSLLDPFGLNAQSTGDTSWSWMGLYNSFATAVVPGQVSWNNAQANLNAGNYGYATLNIASMLGEQALTVATLGGSRFTSAVESGWNSASSLWSRIWGTSAVTTENAAIRTTASLTRLGEQDVVVGMIKEGEILKQVPYGSNPMLAPTHEAIAKELGVWAGVGELAPGVEAFTVWKEGGKIFIRGSGNFTPTVTPQAQAALLKLFN